MDRLSQRHKSIVLSELAKAPPLRLSASNLRVTYGLGSAREAKKLLEQIQQFADGSHDVGAAAAAENEEAEDVGGSDDDSNHDDDDDSSNKYGVTRRITRSAAKKSSEKRGRPRKKKRPSASSRRSKKSPLSTTTTTTPKGRRLRSDDKKTSSSSSSALAENKSPANLEDSPLSHVLASQPIGVEFLATQNIFTVGQLLKLNFRASGTYDKYAQWRQRRGLKTHTRHTLTSDVTKWRGFVRRYLRTFNSVLKLAPRDDDATTTDATKKRGRVSDITAPDNNESTTTSRPQKKRRMDKNDTDDDDDVDDYDDDAEEEEEGDDEQQSPTQSPALLTMEQRQAMSKSIFQSSLSELARNYLASQNVFDAHDLLQANFYTLAEEYAKWRISHGHTPFKNARDEHRAVTMWMSKVHRMAKALNFDLCIPLDVDVAEYYRSLNASKNSSAAASTPVTGATGTPNRTINPTLPKFKPYQCIQYRPHFGDWIGPSIGISEVLSGHAIDFLSSQNICTVQQLFQADMKELCGNYIRWKKEMDFMDIKESSARGCIAKWKSKLKLYAMQQEKKNKEKAMKEGTAEAGGERDGGGEKEAGVALGSSIFYHCNNEREDRNNNNNGEGRTKDPLQQQQGRQQLKEEEEDDEDQNQQYKLKDMFSELVLKFLTTQGIKTPQKLLKTNTTRLAKFYMEWRLKTLTNQEPITDLNAVVTRVTNWKSRVRQITGLEEEEEGEGENDEKGEEAPGSLPSSSSTGLQTSTTANNISGQNQNESMKVEEKEGEQQQQQKLDVFSNQVKHTQNNQRRVTDVEAMQVQSFRCEEERHVVGSGMVGRQQDQAYMI